MGARRHVSIREETYQRIISKRKKSDDHELSIDELINNQFDLVEGKQPKTSKPIRSPKKTREPEGEIPTELQAESVT